MTWFSKRKASGWRAIQENQSIISPDTVVQYFNKRQVLNFNQKSAAAEETAILPHIKKKQNLTVLDLGCGDGRWCRLLHPICLKYLGVDFSSKFIEKARRQYSGLNNVEFLCQPVQDFRSPEKFDYILLVGLITYMNDHEITSLAKNCQEMLRHGGRMVLRSVTLKDSQASSRYYESNPNLAMRLLGRAPYQIIRRTEERELALFPQFSLVEKSRIPDTGYTLYILKKGEI